MYEFEFGDTNSMEISLVYDSVKNGDVDIVLAYSIDARISAYNLVILDDDKSFFPPYDASPLLGDELLEEYPEIEEIISPLFDSFTEEMISELNGKVEIDKESAEDVALEYLKENGLLE